MGYPVPFQNLPITPGNIFKVTFFLNGPNCGITENYYIRMGNANPTPNQMANIGYSYEHVRTPVLATVWSLQAMRYIDVTQPRGGRLIVPTGWPTPGTSPYNPAQFQTFASENNVGAQIRLSDASQTIRRQEIYRGIVQAVIGDQTGGANKINFTGSFINFKTNLPLWFANAGSFNNINLSNGQVGAKFFVKDPSVNFPAVIQTITTGINNWLVFTTLGINIGTPTAPDYVVPPWPAGTKILIGGLRQKCARKLNGFARVVSVVAQVGTPTVYTVTVCKPNCCLGTPILCPQSGQMQLALFNYAPLTSADAEIIAARKVGRPFRLRPGRRPACCV